MQISDNLSESGGDLGSCLQDICCGIDGYEFLSVAILPILLRFIIPLIVHPASLFMIHGDSDDLPLRSR